MGGGSQKVSGPHVWTDSEVNTEGQLRSRPRSPLPFSAQPPWVLGASPGSGSCRTTESGSVCGHLAQTPSDTGTEKGVCPNSTSAPVNSLPVLCHLSPGFLISERFIMCLIAYVICPHQCSSSPSQEEFSRLSAVTSSAEVTVSPGRPDPQTVYIPLHSRGVLMFLSHTAVCRVKQVHRLC